MGLFTKFLNPNKEYEQLFRDIDALGLLKSISNNSMLTIAQFYTLRELLMNSMYKKNSILLQRRLDVLCDDKSAFGLWWIKGMYEDAFGVNITIQEGYSL